MKRRNFLKKLSMLAGIAYLLPTSLITTPVDPLPNYTLGKGTLHFIPSNEIAFESLTLLENNLCMGGWSEGTTFELSDISDCMIRNLYE